MILRPHFTAHRYADVAALYEQRRQANLAVRSLHQRCIVQNWLLHALLEISGRYEEILDVELTVAEPRYDFFLDRHPLKGQNAVRELYRGLVDSECTAIVSDQQHWAVADWGFSSEQVNHQYVNGAVAQRMGVPNAQPDSHYVVHKPVTMVWHYTPDALLVGENLYFAPSSVWGYSPLRAEDFLSTAGMAEALAPLIDRCRHDLRATRLEQARSAMEASHD